MHRASGNTRTGTHGVNVGLEDYHSVSGYGFMKAKGDPVGDDAREWAIQGCGGTNTLNRYPDKSPPRKTQQKGSEKKRQNN